MSKLINRSNIKKVALAESDASRNGKFRRVSGGFFNDMEGILKDAAHADALSLTGPPARVINRQHVKEYMLAVRAQQGLPEVAITNSDLERLEAKIVETVKSRVHSHPSTGVTLMGNS